MNALLIEGYTDVYRNIGAALRLFWPVVATYLVMILVAGVLGFFAALETDTAMLSLLLVGLAATLYVFLALCQGAVGWHRRLLLGEEPGWISPVPRRRGLQYALAAFVYALFFLAAHFLTSYFIRPQLQSWLSPQLYRDFDFTNASVEQLDALREAMLPLQAVLLLVSIVLFSAILWIGRSWLLVYPHISVRTTQPLFAQIRESLNPSFALVGALLVVCFGPSVLGLLYSAVVPISIQRLTVVATFMTLLGVALSAFCIPWGLSVLSIAYRGASAGKIPFDGNDKIVRA